jgi:hypothetical protein
VSNFRATILATPLVLLLAAAVTPARADFTIQQAFAIGSDGAAGSPSFAAWQLNAIQGISNGFTTVGNPATDPTAFQTVTSTSVRDIIPTGDFPSWNGQANPSGAFANELGNLLYAPVIINGNGTLFSLSQVVFTGASSDNPSNPAASLLGNVTPLSNFDYSAGRVGVIFNADGSTTYITSGSSDQQVNELIYRGVASYDQILMQAGSGMTGQQLLDQEALHLSSHGNLTFDATYAIYADATDSGSPVFSQTNSIIINSVPEPSSVVLLGLGGLGILAAAYRRRRSRVVRVRAAGDSARLAATCQSN